MPKYKFGKIERTIDLDTLGKLMDRAELVDRSGYSAKFIKAVLAFLYWTGFRESEVFGAKPKKYVTRKGPQVTENFPPLAREQLWIEDDEGGKKVFIKQRARKHGHRSVISFPVELRFMDLIIEQWTNTKPLHAVFPINYISVWRVFKRIDPKLYPHFFVLNRSTKIFEDPESSLKDWQDFTGKSLQTAGYYSALAGRDTRKVGERFKKET